MVNSRAKGRRAELEFAKRFDGRRISENGLPGPDVETPPLLARLKTFEVKHAERWRIEEWMQQARAEGADGVAFRRNRGPWYVVIEADSLVADHEDELRPDG